MSLHVSENKLQKFTVSIHETLTTGFRAAVVVKNLKRSVDFYKNVIQLELYSQNETSARFKSKNLNVLLTQQNILSNDYYFGNINTSRKGVGVEIIIIVPDIQSIHQRMCEMQIEIE